MHEFSIGQTLVEAALEELKKRSPGRLKKVRIVVGQQHALVPENLLLAYDLLSRHTPAEGSTLEIQMKPIVGRCRQCAWNGEIHHSMYVCGSCGAADIELVGGNELFLDSLEVETHD